MYCIVVIFAWDILKVTWKETNTTKVHRRT